MRPTFSLCAVVLAAALSGCGSPDEETKTTATTTTPPVETPTPTPVPTTPCTPQTWFLDADGDGHGDPLRPVDACEPPDATYVGLGDDCDDTEPLAAPTLAEAACDGLDNDCDPATTDTPDDDGDGVSTCDGDCDDNEPLVAPGLVESSCDGLDNDCDPLTEDAPDDDTDGVTTCDGDCDDNEPLVARGFPEVPCDGLDNDCTILTSDTPDDDADGLGLCDGDCDDNEPLVRPGLPERTCDGLDNDCDPLTEDAPDDDADGLGLCDGDCDDNEPLVRLGLPERTCDGLDNDCDPLTGDAPDDDTDGVGLCDGDCDDNEPLVRPGASEVLCDDLDNDCDPLTPDGIDGDGDGATCDDDCNDADPLVFVGAVETCSGIDNDCSGIVDDGAATCPCTPLTGPDGRAYLLCSERRPWADAQAACEAVGYDLATIVDAAENGWLQGQLAGGPAWIGWNDQVVEGDFTWVSGEIDTYAVWQAGQPDDADPGEDCAVLRADGTWADTDCGLSIDYLCESACYPGDWYLDGDGDGYGDASIGISTTTCSQPFGYSRSPDDCDDTEPRVNPGTPEVPCDGLDNDCHVATVDTPDADADGFGLCDDDCDDTDPTVNPSGVELECDRLDNDCDPLTEDDPDLYCFPTAIFDTFETGAIDPRWSSLTGDAAVTDTQAYDGAYSLALGGGGAVLVSNELDLVDCDDTVLVSFWLKRGPEAPDPSDELLVGYDGSDGFVPLASIPGTGTTDPAFAFHAYPIDDPATWASGLVVSLGSLGSGSGFDVFHIDDLSIACDTSDDADGDGVTVAAGDCDDLDPDVFPGQAELTCDGVDNDCDPLTLDTPDVDGDGFGACDGDCDDADPDVFPGQAELTCDGIDNDCDPLTADGDDADGDGVDSCTDCDDADPTTYPGAADPLDGVDSDCDGLDVALFHDGFEGGVLDLTRWASLTGDHFFSPYTVATGVYSLRLGGGGATLTSLGIDTSACAAGVGYALRMKRGPEMPDPTDLLELAYDPADPTLASAVVATTWYGGFGTEPTFTAYSDALGLDAISPTLYVRLHSRGSLFGFDHFFVDDVTVGCLP